MTTTLDAESMAGPTEPGAPTPPASHEALERVRRLLARDPFATAYMLGDLDPVYAGYCSWWMAREADRDVAVLQVYTGLSAPVLLTHGSPAGLNAILGRFVDDMPARAHVHLMPEHLAVLHRFFEIDRLRPMVRMGLRGPQLEAGTLPHADLEVGAYGGIERLGHRDTGDIMELFSHYPDSFFEPHQLSSGHYYGVRTRSAGGPPRLVSVAGVHIVSRTERLAALGNIVTHPEHRGQGLSTRLTAHLCRALVSEGIELLALNVERKNTSALRVYEKLGFREHCTYLEGFLVRTLGRVLREGVADEPLADEPLADEREPA